MFSCRELLFPTLFSCEQPQATDSCEKGCFSRTSDATLGRFFFVVLDLARPSEPQLIFFDTVLLRAATGNRISRKRLFF